MLSIKPGWTLFCGMVMLCIAAFPASAKEDRYIGYYYPAPDAVETYCARVPAMPNMDRRRRIGFIIGIHEGMVGKPYESAYAVFAKGGEARKLIIVAKQDGYLTTVYRVRALLADLTTSVRTMPVFDESGAAENLTFLDLLTILGFETITVSDGDKFAHQFRLQLQPGSNCK